IYQWIAGTAGPPFCDPLSFSCRKYFPRFLHFHDIVFTSLSFDLISQLLKFLASSATFLSGCSVHGLLTNRIEPIEQFCETFVSGMDEHSHGSNHLVYFRKRIW